MEKSPPQTIDEYLSRFPDETRTLLETVRKIVLESAPNATEGIGYQMPSYKWKGILVYFAGYKNHIGFYPTGSCIEAFRERLQGFKWSKGAVQFPIHQPLPQDLIREMVMYRVAENEKK